MYASCGIRETDKTDAPGVHGTPREQKHVESFCICSRRENPVHSIQVKVVVNKPVFDCISIITMLLPVPCYPDIIV